MNILNKRWLILLLISLVLLIGSIMAVVSFARTNEVPNMLQVRRVNLIPPNHYAPFSQRSITDTQSVQRLYNAVQTLPRFTPHSPPIPMSCPNDLGLEYVVDFFQDSHLIQEITIDSGGCEFVKIGSKDIRRYSDTQFWQILAQALNLSEKELAPMPLFSCTPHSPCPSPTP